MARMLIALLVLLLMAGCSDDSKKLGGNNTVNNQQPSKEEAEAMGGVDGDGNDLCELLNWYGDGECDDWCPEFDDDCEEEPPPDPCETNADCAPNGFCSVGECIYISGACGASTGLTCDEGEFCGFPDGSCGNMELYGTCKAIAQACPDNVEPVCGCDNLTYGNPCEADAAGVSIKASGPCAAIACSEDNPCATGFTCKNDVCVQDVRCGARAGETCQGNEYCAFPLEAACGVADGEGVCRPQPDVCTRELDPVCGCDGEVYSNECNANAAGTARAPDDTCDLPCIDNSECAMGEICVAGECRTENRACMDTRQCESGETCTEGFCVPNSRCGGLLGLQCSAAQWCDYPETTVCGQADFFGQCQPRPEACPDVFDPVCGCDGKTYGNACEAHAAGADVMATGPCQF